VQHAVTLIRAYLPVLHLEMEFSINPHFQSPEIIIEFPTH